MYIHFDMKISSTPLILCLYLVFAICIIQASIRQRNRSKRWDIDGDFGIVKNYEPLKNFDDGVYLVEKPLCSDGNENCDNGQNNLLYTMPLKKHETMLHPPVTANFITGLKKVPKVKLPENVSVHASVGGTMDSSVMKIWTQNCFKSRGLYLVRTKSLLVMDSFGSHKREDVLYMLKRKKKSALQQRAGFMCSCEGKRIFRDLGMDYYPRYVPTIACKAGGCYAGFQCREKKYSVTVLKKKEMDDKMEKEFAAEYVPDILKELFVPKVLTVGVSCECAP